jgi:hypothetical protein
LCGGGGPVCASPDTPIATPTGERPIAEIRVGDLVYSVDHGAIRAVPVARIGSTRVAHHKVVEVRLNSGRRLAISPSHPIGDGRSFGDLRRGDVLDGYAIESAELVSYVHDATYDILPASETGMYFAAGAAIASTLADRNVP